MVGSMGWIVEMPVPCVCWLPPFLPSSLGLLSETHTCICSYLSLLMGTIAYDASLDHWYERGKGQYLNGLSNQDPSEGEGVVLELLTDTYNNIPHKAI